MTSIYRLPLYILGGNEGEELLLYPQIHYTKWITKIDAALFRYGLKYRAMFESTDETYQDREIYQAAIAIYSETIPPLLTKLEAYEDYAFLYDIYNTNYFQPWLGSILNFLPFDEYDIVVIEGLVLIRIPDTQTDFQNNDIENLALYKQIKEQFTAFLETSYTDMVAAPVNVNLEHSTIIKSTSSYNLVKVDPVVSPYLFSCNTLAEVVSKIVAGFPLTLKFGRDSVKESQLNFEYEIAYSGCILIRPKSLTELIDIQKSVFTALNYRDNLNEVGIELFYNKFSDAQEASHKVSAHDNRAHIQYYLSTIRPYRLVGRLANLGFEELNSFMDSLKALKQK